MSSIFERYLTLWVGICIIGGITLGKLAPNLAKTLDSMSISVNGAPIISIPIAICLFFMMYPIMVKIDFAEVLKAGRSVRPVGLTLFVNWAVKPFTMYAISLFFLGTLFYGLIGPDAVDQVKMPFPFPEFGDEPNDGVIPGNVPLLPNPVFDLFGDRIKSIQLDAAIYLDGLFLRRNPLPETPINERLRYKNHLVTPSGSQAFERSKEHLSPRGFLGMKGKAVDRVNDDRYSGKFSSETS